MRRYWIGLMFAMLLSGCGQGFSGDYEDAMGIKYSFQNDGKVNGSHSGSREEDAVYARRSSSENRRPVGRTTLTLNILDDGTLQGEGIAGIMHLKKVQ